MFCFGRKREKAKIIQNDLIATRQPSGTHQEASSADRVHTVNEPTDIPKDDTSQALNEQISVYMAEPSLRHSGCTSSSGTPLVSFQTRSHMLTNNYGSQSASIAAGSCPSMITLLACETSSYDQSVVLYQNAMSKSYYGDMRRASRPGRQSTDAVAFLRQLFSLEGEEVLQDMLSEAATFGEELQLHSVGKQASVDGTSEDIPSFSFNAVYKQAMPSNGTSIDSEEISQSWRLAMRVPGSLLPAPTSNSKVNGSRVTITTLATDLGSSSNTTQSKRTRSASKLMLLTADSERVSGRASQVMNSVPAVSAALRGVPEQVMSLMHLAMSSNGSQERALNKTISTREHRRGSDSVSASFTSALRHKSLPAELEYEKSASSVSTATASPVHIKVNVVQLDQQQFVTTTGQEQHDFSSDPKQDCQNRAAIVEEGSAPESTDELSPLPSEGSRLAATSEGREAATCLSPTRGPYGGGAGEEGYLYGMRTEEGLMEEPCWHEVVITPLKHPDDGRKLLLITQTDITARTELEMALAHVTDSQLNMLNQIFPRHVIEFLITGGTSAQVPKEIGRLARSHELVTILFMDIVGFTTMAKQVPPVAVMTFLNELFSIFDDLATLHGVQKVETAGDCYIVASGVLASDSLGFSKVKQEHDPYDSAARVLAFAKDMLVSSRLVLMPHDGSHVVIRIGIHTGPCVSGLVGSKLPKFSIFGDTMNTASRMESTSTPGCIQVSLDTHHFLTTGPSESITDEWRPTGGVEVKGKGKMDTFIWQEAAAVILVRPPPPHASRRQSVDNQHGFLQLRAAGSYTMASEGTLSPSHSSALGELVMVNNTWRRICTDSVVSESDLGAPDSIKLQREHERESVTSRISDDELLEHLERSASQPVAVSSAGSGSPVLQKSRGSSKQQEQRMAATMQAAASPFVSPFSRGSWLVASGHEDNSSREASSTTAALQADPGTPSSPSSPLGPQPTMHVHPPRPFNRNMSVTVRRPARSPPSRRRSMTFNDLSTASADKAAASPTIVIGPSELKPMFMLYKDVVEAAEAAAGANEASLLTTQNKLLQQEQNGDLGASYDPSGFGSCAQSGEDRPSGPEHSKSFPRSSMGQLPGGNPMAAAALRRTSACGLSPVVAMAQAMSAAQAALSSLGQTSRTSSTSSVRGRRLSAILSTPPSHSPLGPAAFSGASSTSFTAAPATHHSLHYKMSESAPSPSPLILSRQDMLVAGAARRGVLRPVSGEKATTTFDASALPDAGAGAAAQSNEVVPKGLPPGTVVHPVLILDDEDDPVRERGNRNGRGTGGRGT